MSQTSSASRSISIAMAATLAAVTTWTGVATAQEKPFAGQRLSVLMVGHPTTDAVRKALPDFTTATGIDVDLEVVPEADSVPKMMLELSAGSGRYDVVEASSIHVKGFVGADYIAGFGNSRTGFPLNPGQRFH